jgi:hypothetical protein
MVSVPYGQPRSPSKYSDDRVLFKGLLREFWNAHLGQCTGFDTGTVEIFELTGSKEAERNTILQCYRCDYYRSANSGKGTQSMVFLRRPCLFFAFGSIREFQIDPPYFATGVV